MPYEVRWTRRATYDVDAGGEHWVPGQVRVYENESDIPDEIMDDPLFERHWAEWGEARIEKCLHFQTVQAPEPVEAPKPKPKKRAKKAPTKIEADPEPDDEGGDE